MVSKEQALFEYSLRLGDDALILGHRLSEWCGHGPILEEDLALGNIALDLIGHAQALLAFAGKIEDHDRNEDKLVYFRGEREYRNCKLVELPKGDFAFTIARQFIFDTYSVLLYQGLSKCSQIELAGLASKFLKEHLYHLRHSSEWIIRLGDGTQESHARLNRALLSLWPFTGELFETDSLEELLSKEFELVKSATLKASWIERTSEVFKKANLELPEDCWMHSGGRKGLHTEWLGKLLAEMQSLPRANPEATW